MNQTVKNDKRHDNNDILTSHPSNVHLLQRIFSIFGKSSPGLEVSVKPEGLCTGMKCRKKAKAEPYRLPTSPGPLAGFYFSCGPLAALGFFIGGLQGFVLAIIGNAVLWLLLAWRRDKN